MKIIFLSHDGPIHRLVEALDGDVHLAQSEDETLEFLEDVADDEECLLFLDFDIDKKKMEVFNKSISSNEWITRIIVSGTMKVKEFKKHQKGKTSAHGYVLKPFTGEVLKGILNDLEISHLLEEQNLYEEGTQLPDLPSNSQLVQGLDNIDDSYVHDESEDEVDFGASEFKMNTEVRHLVDLHSVKGESSPFEGELNDKIQEKFNTVFGADYFESDKEVGQADQQFMGGSDGLSMDLSLKEETQGSIALDLGEESTELSGADDLDLGAELIEEEEVDLDSSDDYTNEEIDLEAMDIDGEDAGELNIDDEEAEIDLSGEDLDEELDRLTEERVLPSKEELAEFDEETGEIDISPLENSEEMSFEKSDFDPSESFEQEDDEIDLSDGTDDFTVDSINLDEIESENVNEDSEDILEEDIMTDDNQDNEELLEFEDDELVEDGELAFSTEPEAEVSSDKEDDGGLDFNLGGIDEESDDLGVEDTSAVDTTNTANEEEGFSLDDDIEGMDLESDVESTSIEKFEGDDEGMSLEADLDDAGEDFELGDDAVLGGADPSNDQEEALEMSEDDDLDLSESVAEETTEEAKEDSEFDNDELSFADDEDEEIEKTQAISINNLSASAIDEAEEEVEEDDEALAALDDDEDDISLDGEEEFVAQEEDSGEDDFAAAEDLFEDVEEEEATNPTMVMSEDMTKELEEMVDVQATNEFRPGMEDNDTALLDEDDLLGDEDIGEEPGEYTATVTTKVKDEGDFSRENQKESTPSGTLNITSTEERIPPSFNEGEAVRLQATIRQLREEREELLQDIQGLKKEKKLVDQDNLGLKAELDEAKIEISILKKRHSSEMDEMKYRLRITDEKKLYSEEKARKLQKEFDRLQSKVRIDFNQIKQREKELESQLELAKMDSESQVQSRDKKILELKRKIDQLEFNMENIVIREQKSRDDKMRLEERLERIMKTLRGSIEVLEDDIEFDGDGKRNRE